MPVYFEYFSTAIVAIYQYSIFTLFDPTNNILLIFIKIKILKIEILKCVHKHLETSQNILKILSYIENDIINKL